jgi:hypothetical protein
MPGGQPLFHGTHPHYEGPTLPDIMMAEEEAYLELEMVASTIQEVQGNPKTLSEACSCTDWLLWKAAMEKEIAMLECTGTWSTVPRLTGRNIVGSKQVYRIK